MHFTALPRCLQRILPVSQTSRLFSISRSCPTRRNGNHSAASVAVWKGGKVFRPLTLRQTALSLNRKEGCSFWSWSKTGKFRVVVPNLELFACLFFRVFSKGLERCVLWKRGEKMHSLCRIFATKLNFKYQSGRAVRLQ